MILSHVLEHLLDFSMLALLRDVLAESRAALCRVCLTRSGMSVSPRLEYLYYFDRLHVNHFSPQALAATSGRRLD